MNYATNTPPGLNIGFCPFQAAKIPRPLGWNG